jgi:hypothetical protein
MLTAIWLVPVVGGLLVGVLPRRFARPVRVSNASGGGTIPAAARSDAQRCRRDLSSRGAREGGGSGPPTPSEAIGTGGG